MLGSKAAPQYGLPPPGGLNLSKLQNNTPIKDPHHSLDQHPPLLQAQNEERTEGVWKKKGKAIAPERC